MVKTAAVHLAHVEEERANKDEGVDSEDPDGIKGVTKEFMVHLVRPMKDAQKEINAAITVAAWTTLSVTSPL